MFPTSLKLPKGARKSVRDWAKQFPIPEENEDCSMSSYLSVTVTASGIGDNFEFNYLGHKASGFWDDWDGTWVLKYDSV